MLKKILFIALIGIFSTTLYAAPRKGALGKFTHGSVVAGTPALGSVKRWYLMNEGGIGGGYTSLGQMQSYSLEFTWASYIRTITKFEGFSPVFGIEANIPIYLGASGKSNLYNGKWPINGVDSKFYEILGGGIEVPLVLGLQFQYFYIQALVGYSYSFIREQYTATDGSHPRATSGYHGLIYGGSMGFRFGNVVNLGLRVTSGVLENIERKSTSDSIIPASHNFHVRSIHGTLYVSVTF